MNDNQLKWREIERTTVFTTRIFSVAASISESPKGERGTFSLLETNPWALVIPVLESDKGRQFVMVRQWRHGMREICVEFPGGVVEAGEDIEKGAKRELREETGFHAGKISLLGTMNPNPAFMCNTFSVFLAEDLVFDGNQELDNDEFVDVELHDVDEVVRNMGKPPYSHALMAAALSFWLRLPQS